MSLKYFGTDGIRGPYGSSVLNESIAYRAGRSAAIAAKRLYEADTPQLLIGRDTRASGASLEQAIAAGFIFEGGVVVSLGVAPTPAVAYMTKVTEAAMGCSVTASHNPSSDNGIKFFQSEGVKPSEALEVELDEGVGQVDADSWSDETEIEIASLESSYADAIVGAFDEDFLSGKRIAIDCANGAMANIASGVFEALGAEVTAIGVEPNGLNINDGVGSEHPESIMALLDSASFDLAFAFDGDGDRVIAFDENGKRLSGESVMSLLAIDAMTHGELGKNVLVTTVQSNLGLDHLLKMKDIDVKRVDVGDKHISRLMIPESYSLGGEESGHLVIGDFAMTGDGLCAALKVAKTVVRSGRTLASWGNEYEAFPQESIAMRVKEKQPLADCTKLQAVISELTEEMGIEGRMLIRYSGTEPKLRLLVEAKTQEKAEEAMGRLRLAVECDLGVESNDLAQTAKS